MVVDGVRVLGATGTPVLLLPGGAEACDGFFPGLPEGLVADPGCRVILLARDHPEAVAGLVLLDPTPLNGPAGCARIERSMAVVERVVRVPLLRRALSAALRAWSARERRRLDLRPDCAAAHARIGDVDIGTLARSVRGITALSAGMRESDLPRVPAVVVTADRRPTDGIRTAHTRLADALDAPLVMWPGARHNLHLDHPEETLATVRELVRRVGVSR